ncbi:TonB-dependent receptor [Arenimonas sp.]|uniref:TonB-dependent receptor plug domain-containing protein n=1 Tax=Arenimonas sp. TaxID=1872635 RepID=UPI0025C43E45|nr:TonB-dependent receptor [Arenimonas sp.]
MKSKPHPLSSAVRFALSASAIGILGLAAMPAIAQDAAAPAAAASEPTTLDRIEVLGSRIRRAEGDTALPVLSIERAEIERTGLTQLADILREISVNGPSLSLNTNNGNTSGNSSVNLRNCASNRTLVLVNGRRWVSGNGLDGTVDLSSIPLAAVEGIDILKDGASALYGSDALCGVINVRTRTDFEGAMVTGYYGQYQQGDGERESVSYTIGGSSDRFSGLLNLSYTDTGAVSAGDRAISAVPLFGFPANVSTPGRASPVGPYGNFTVAGRGNITLNPGSPGCQVNQVCAPSTGANDFRTFNFLTDGYNFAPDNYLSQPQTQYSLFGQVSYQLSDPVRFRSEVFYNRREGEAQLAAQPLSPLNITANNVYNPFGVAITGGAFRPTDFPRLFGQEQDTWRFSGAFDGAFELGDRYFYWDAGYTFAENRQLQPKNGFYFSSRVALGTGQSHIDSSGIARCGPAGAPIAGCVPLNFMGGPDGFTREMFDYIAVNPKNVQKYSQESYTANLSGDLFDLPAGPMAFAFGVEHRVEEGSSEPDPLTAAGLVLGDNPFLPTRGSYKVDEVYAELNIPLLADVTFAKSLELSLAGRYSDYSSFGDTTNPKASLRWQPSETVLVRGSWGEGFRAASVSELFAGRATGRPAFQDPCSASNTNFQNNAAIRAQCLATGAPVGFQSLLSQTFGTTGGNPNLQPETSVSKTLGIVYSPGWMEGLDMYLDWYNLQIENAIGSLAVATILTECYQQLNQNSCALITRDTTGAVNGNPGEISNILATNINFRGGLETEGYDFGASYRFDTDNWGRYQIRWDNTYVAYFGDLGKPERGELNADGRISAGNVVGTLPSGSSAGAPRHRLRSNLNVAWQMGDFTVSATMEYRSRVRETCNNVFLTATRLAQVDPAYGSLVNLCSDPNRVIDVYSFRTGTNEIIATPTNVPSNMLGGTTYTHLQGTWAAPWNGKISVGVRNLFNKQPPFSSDAFANSYDAQYLIPGRFYYLNYEQTF